MIFSKQTFNKIKSTYIPKNMILIKNRSICIGFGNRAILLQKKKRKIPPDLNINMVF